MLGQVIRDYPYVHTIIGIMGNLMFVVGSVLFFKVFDVWYSLAVWLFVLGSTFMLVGAVGEGLIRMIEHRERQAGAAK